MILNKAAFIDRDGVINKDYGYVHEWKDFEFCDGVFEGLKRLIELGYIIIIITNQSGIARGLFTEYQYKKLTANMINFLKQKNINITAIYHCPHHPDYSNNFSTVCNCRKPKPGLFIKASKEFNISMKHSIAIGDSERDLVAAKLAGIKNRYFIINQKTNSHNNNFQTDNYTSTFKSLFDCSISLES